MCCTSHKFTCTPKMLICSNREGFSDVLVPTCIGSFSKERYMQFSIDTVDLVPQKTLFRFDFTIQT